MFVRALCALSAFVLCLSTGFWFLHSKRQRHAAPASAQPAHEIKEGADDTIFYRTIGQLPQSAKSPLQKSELADNSQQHYTLELGVAATEAEATKLLARLEAQGIIAFYTPMKSNGRVVYRIRQGVYQQYDIAASARQELEASGKARAKVVHLR